MAKKNKIKYEGELDLAGLEISCYVLEDGTRVLSGRGMQNALKIVDDADTSKQSSGTRLNRYLNQKTLQPFIYGKKEQGHYSPLICYRGEQKVLSQTQQMGTIFPKSATTRYSYAAIA